MDDQIRKIYWIATEQITTGRWSRDSLRGDAVEEILICYFNPKTRAQIDGSFRFYVMGDKTIPKLVLFADCWLGLAELGPGFLATLGKLDRRSLGREPNRDDIVDALKSVGFRAGVPRRD